MTGGKKLLGVYFWCLYFVPAKQCSVSSFRLSCPELLSSDKLFCQDVVSP